MIIKYVNLRDTIILEAFVGRTPRDYHAISEMSLLRVIVRKLLNLTYTKFCGI